MNMISRKSWNNLANIGKEVSLLSTLKNIGKRRSWWESCFQNQEKEIIEEKAKVIQGRMVAFCPCLKDPFF